MKNTEKFIKSPIFLQLGRAIDRENWQTAMMQYRKLEKGVAENEITQMQSHLKGIRIAIVQKNKVQAQNALTRLTVVRVGMLKEMM